MARIRTIKPEFWKNEALCEQPESTHMLAAGLINYADDEGYFNANPSLIKGEIFPLREPSVSIPESLRRLQTIAYLRIGTGVDGRRYGHIVEFVTHQRVSHPTSSKISCLSITWDTIEKHHEIIVSPPEVIRPERNREQGIEQGTGNSVGVAPLALAQPPEIRVVEPIVPKPKLAPAAPLPEIPECLNRATRWESGRAVPAEWIADAQGTRRTHGLPEINLDLEAAKFADHWASKPGKDGRKLDWRLTWLNWARGARGTAAPARPQQDYFRSGEIIRLTEKGAA